MSDILLAVLPIYIFIVIVLAAIGYFWWKSKTIEEEAGEELGIVDFLRKYTEDLETNIIETTESITANIAEKIETIMEKENIGNAILEYFLGVINDQKTLNEIIPHLEPLKILFEGNLGFQSMDPEVLNQDTGRGVLNMINEKFGFLGIKALEWSLGEDWEKITMDNPQRAIGVLKTASNFGILDMIEGTNNKISGVMGKITQDIKSNNSNLTKNKSLPH